MFLPVSLVHLWSIVEAGNPHSERCHQILDMTMSLLSVVAIACSRVMSLNHAHLYLTNMYSYLNSLKILFPDYSLHPNHHMALCLLPTFYFMALSILVDIPFWATLQHISTNYKLGKFYNLLFSLVWIDPGFGLSCEYEKTISHSFVWSAALKSLILKIGTPEVIQNCEPIFEKLINPQTQSTLLTDILSFSATEALDSTDNNDLLLVHLKPASQLPHPLKDCIWKHFGSLPISASTLSQLTVAGLTYSVALRHSENSCVLLDYSPSKTIFLPAQIEYIFQFVSDNNFSNLLWLLLEGSKNIIPYLIHFPAILYFKLRYGAPSQAALNYTQSTQFSVILLLLPCYGKVKKSWLWSLYLVYVLTQSCFILA